MVDGQYITFDNNHKFGNGLVTTLCNGWSGTLHSMTDFSINALGIATWTNLSWTVTNGVLQN